MEKSIARTTKILREIIESNIAGDQLVLRFCCQISRRQSSCERNPQVFPSNRFATCSHDSKILNAGACPCSSMKILMKLDISSESFEILKTKRTMRECRWETLACIDRRESRVSSRLTLCHSSDSNRDDEVYDWWRESDSCPERGQRNVYA